MLDPSYFARPLTYLSVQHPRLGKRNVEQRPVEVVPMITRTGRPLRVERGVSNCAAA